VATASAGRNVWGKGGGGNIKLTSYPRKSCDKFLLGIGDIAAAALASTHASACNGSNLSKEKLGAQAASEMQQPAKKLTVLQGRSAATEAFRTQTTKKCIICT